MIMTTAQLEFSLNKTRLEKCVKQLKNAIKKHELSFYAKHDIEERNKVQSQLHSVFDYPIHLLGVIQTIENTTETIKKEVN